MKKIAVLIMCFISVNLYAQQSEVVDYIKQNAVALNVADFNTGYEDLIPLKAVLSNRRIIGMGEATHGTHEFQQTKMRMFKLLVQEMGYKIFAVEANFTECRTINDYILYGKGTALNAMHTGDNMWAWNTKDILELIEWMRSYNKKVPDSAKVKFYGFDMQSKTLAVKNIVAKLKILDSTFYQNHFNALDSFKVFNIINKIKFRRLDDKQADSAKQLLTAIKTYIDNNNYKMVKLFTINDIAYLKRDVRLVEQCLDQSLTYGNISGDDYKLRNKYMAENIEWISKYEGPESKIMLCAHNGHISKDDMGSYLKKDYKDQYYAIGFDFNKGSFRAIDIDKSHHTPPFFTVNEAKKGSSGELFNKLNIPAFFIDVEKAIKPNSAAKSFFNKNIEQRNIGWGFSTAKEKNFYSGGSIYSKFDGLIFINATTPTIGS